MDKWNLIIDVALCQNCNNCVLAAKDELVGNAHPGYSAPHSPQGHGVVRMERQVRGEGHHTDAAYRPVMCNHCDDAPCIRAGGGAVTKRADGIVLFDPDRTRGRRDLVDSCPYGAVVWNEAAQCPQTWFFDAHLLDAGAKVPRCVGVCPTSAIEAVRIADEAMAQRVAQENLRPLGAAEPTLPRVYYRNWERIERLFVAGTVLIREAGVVDCAAGAEVELWIAGSRAASARSDDFGDFKFDGIAPSAGAGEVRATFNGMIAQSRPVHIAERSLTVGEFMFERH
jgi:Fe-S-cluster-containing dehydrogenase component